LTPTEDRINEVVKEYGPLTLPEVAGVFGENYTTINMIFHRAMNKLKERWRDEIISS